MNIKVFNIRLEKEFFQSDQDRMNQFLDSVEVKLASTNFVTSGSKDFWSATVLYLPKLRKQDKRDSRIVEDDLSPNQLKTFNSLRQWRNELATQLNWSPFRICHNAHLVAIAKSKPKNIKELQEIPGFGKGKIEKYGEEIISILNTL